MRGLKIVKQNSRDIDTASSLSPPEVLKLPIIAQLQKASPWNVPSSGAKGGGGGSVVRVGSGRSPFISRLQTPQSGVSHFAQVRLCVMFLLK